MSRFQFYNSPIKSYEENNIDINRKESFNSTIVQLNRGVNNEKFYTSTRFQFYNSPIKSKKNKGIYKEGLTSFNSTIVRLNPSYYIKIKRLFYSFNSTIVRLNLFFHIRQLH